MEEDFVEEGILDQTTLKTLYKLSSKSLFDSLGGAVDTGKEADVFHATKGDKEIALKIYRTTTSRFKEMKTYLSNDPRIKSFGSSQRDIIYRWTKREFRNLRKASEVVRVPEPYCFDKNVLAMEFIGENGIKAPSLKTIPLENWEKVAELCIKILKKLYRKGIVHGDFSEYNILVMKELVLIDLGQAIELDHPFSERYLTRDVKNIVNFFKKKDLDIEVEEVLKKVKSS